MTKRQCVDRVTKTRVAVLTRLVAGRGDRRLGGSITLALLLWIHHENNATTRLAKGVRKVPNREETRQTTKGAQVTAKGRRRCVLWRDEATGAHEAQEPKAKVEKDTGRRSRPSVVVRKPKQSKAK